MTKLSQDYSRDWARLKSLPSNNSPVICEATHCHDEATVELNIPIGATGTWDIYVCKNCVRKFKRFEHKQM